MREWMRARRMMILLFVMGPFLCCLWLMFEPCTRHPNAAIIEPEFIDSVFPQPGVEISLSCYYRKNIQILVLPPLEEDEGGIIARVSTWSFIEQEIPRFNNEPPLFVNRVSLFIDGSEVAPTWVWSSGENMSIIYPSGDEVEIPLSAHYVFGTNPFLLPGDHTAKVVIETLSGETLEYEWQFTITFP